MPEALVITGDIHGEEVFRSLPSPKRLWLTNQPYECSLHISDNDWSFMVTQGGRAIDLRRRFNIYVRRPLPPRPEGSLPHHAREFLLREQQEVITAAVAITALKNCGRVFCLGRQPHLAANKIVQLVLARDLGLLIPETCVTNLPTVANEFYDRHAGAIVYKCLSTPVVEYEDGRKSMIHTSAVTHADFTAVENCASLFQKNIRKRHELRVAVIGDRVIPIRIDSQGRPEARQDWRKAITEPSMYCSTDIPAQVGRGLVQLHERLGIPWGMADLIVSEAGEYLFLETNPDGAWLWLEDVLPELGVTRAIADRIGGFE